jgi:hypothetical protein
VSRLLEGTEFVGQKTTEQSDGSCLGLERPANVADFLHEFHITFWQSDIGRLLWWHVRNLLKGAETRQTPRILTKASYLSLGSLGTFGSVLITFKAFISTFISLSNVKLEIGPETFENGVHTPKKPPK